MIIPCRSCPRVGMISVTILAIVFVVGLASVPLRAAEKISFSEDIYPVIQIRCLACHQPQGDGYEKSGFDLRTYQGLMKGTKFGTMVIPGNAFMSNLMVLIEGRGAPEIRMPHSRKKLSNCDTRLFRLWIDQGAKDN
ncbi:MAG: c-type cytochrome domain-containing protein [Alphaproteobacteria bacterium]|nr:c-type cytochrome domain-containing protein [Alphaproteobacteria bacterium]